LYFHVIVLMLATSQPIESNFFKPEACLTWNCRSWELCRLSEEQMALNMAWTGTQDWAIHTSQRAIRLFSLDSLRAARLLYTGSNLLTFLAQVQHVSQLPIIHWPTCNIRNKKLAKGWKSRISVRITKPYVSSEQRSYVISTRKIRTNQLDDKIKKAKVQSEFYH